MHHKSTLKNNTNLQVYNTMQHGPNANICKVYNNSIQTSVLYCIVFPTFRCRWLSATSITEHAIRREREAWDKARPESTAARLCARCERARVCGLAVGVNKLARCSQGARRPLSPTRHA